MKNIFLTLVQFVLFLVTFAAGSFFPPFHIQRILSASETGTHVFIADGLLLMLLLFVALLIIEALRGRIRTSGPWTVLALVLAAAAGFALKFGLLTLER